MKKRLLALALCLVMMTSLLPITAAAANTNKFAIDSIKLTADSLDLDADPMEANGLTADFTYGGQGEPPLEYNLEYGLYYDGNGLLHLTCRICLKDWEFDTPRIPKCTFDVPGYTSELHRSEMHLGDSGTVIFFDFILRAEHVHDWQFTQTENSLTATCLNEGCPIGSASLTLDAHSVTLPDSPFNAQAILKGITEPQIIDEFRYTIGPICYKFKAPGDSNFTDITPADGAKEGTYQAAVTLSPMVVAALYARNDDGTTNRAPIVGNDGSIILYTQYTAVNPQTTAQTGDNRPIEIMMASALVFSALAAAAFIVDNKRKYSR